MINNNFFCLSPRYFKCRTEYEILAPNQHVLFLLEIYNKASAFSIKVSDTALSYKSIMDMNKGSNGIC